jgi:hypothetical protein
MLDESTRTASAAWRSGAKFALTVSLIAFFHLAAAFLLS